MKRFTPAHEWIEIEGDLATIGITDYAQKELGDIVYVELPTVGTQLKSGEEVIVLESTKAAIDIYTPLSGEIVDVNTLLREYPEKVNQKPESEGWLFKIKFTNQKEIETFLDEKGYAHILST